MNPLSTIKGTIIGGVVLAIVIALIVAVLAKTGIAFNTPSFIIWLHILSGITWIGLLYYFNFVQVPALAAAAADKAARAALASPSTSPRARCCGSVGVRCSPGSRARVPPATSASRPRVHARPRSERLLPRHLHRPRRVAGHDHAVQRLGADLAESEKDAGHGAGDGGAERAGAPHRVPRLAHEHPVVDSDAHVHGELRTRRILPVDVRSAVRAA